MFGPGLTAATPTTCPSSSMASSSSSDGGRNLPAVDAIVSTSRFLDQNLLQVLVQA